MERLEGLYAVTTRSETTPPLYNTYLVVAINSKQARAVAVARATEATKEPTIAVSARDIQGNLAIAWNGTDRKVGEVTFTPTVG